LDSPDDGMGGHGEDGAGGIWIPGPFGNYANSKCFRCSKVTERKTAELLYMGSQWDYYYCFRCRGWFKKPFLNDRVVLPVTDGKAVKHLTWIYTSHLEAVHENRKMLERVERVWHGLERRLLRI
jgi:hypothetical protein